MRSHNKFQDNVAGFSLLEMMLVMGIATILVASTLPITQDIFRRNDLENTEALLIHDLRRAQTDSRYQKADSSYGVYITENDVTLVVGESYLSRNTEDDVIKTLPAGVEIAGIQEVVFEKNTGMPNQNGEITFTIGEYSRTINITEYGNISLSE